MAKKKLKCVLPPDHRRPLWNWKASEGEKLVDKLVQIIEFAGAGYAKIRPRVGGVYSIMIYITLKTRLHL